MTKIRWVTSFAAKVWVVRVQHIFLTQSSMSGNLHSLVFVGEKLIYKTYCSKKILKKKSLLNFIHIKFVKSMWTMFVRGYLTLISMKEILLVVILNKTIKHCFKIKYYSYQSVVHTVVWSLRSRIWLCFPPVTINTITTIITPIFLSILLVKEK